MRKILGYPLFWKFFFENLKKRNIFFSSLPAPDYPGSQIRRPSPDSSTTNNNNPLSKYSSLAELDHLVERFATLFVRDRHEIMRTLDDLPEFRGSEELQLKTMFTVIVVSDTEKCNGLNGWKIVKKPLPTWSRFARKVTQTPKFDLYRENELSFRKALLNWKIFFL